MSASSLERTVADPVGFGAIIRMAAASDLQFVELRKKFAGRQNRIRGVPLDVRQGVPAALSGIGRGETFSRFSEFGEIFCRVLVVLDLWRH